MTIDDLGQDTRAEILAIAARHGVERVRVSGSFAGRRWEHGDLDLLIDAGPCTPRSFPGGLLAHLEEAPGRRVGVAEEKTLPRLIRDPVIHDAISL